MITKEVNGVTMELSADCYFGMAEDVGIVQRYIGPDVDDFAFIGLSVTEAEDLLLELHAAITTVHTILDEQPAEIPQERAIHVDQFSRGLFRIADADDVFVYDLETTQAYLQACAGRDNQLIMSPDTLFLLFDPR